MGASVETTVALDLKSMRRDTVLSHQELESTHFLPADVVEPSTLP